MLKLALREVAPFLCLPEFCAQKELVDEQGEDLI
jgi:hypothetical protein